MNTRKQNIFISIFIAFTMVASIMGFAMMRNSQIGSNQNTMVIPDIVNRTLTPQETIYVLRTGKAIIDFVFPGNCTSCKEKLEMYKNFVSSKEFKGYVVLSYAISNNETGDWLLNQRGDRIDLSNVNNMTGLRKLFCEKVLIKPDVCILEEV